MKKSKFIIIASCVFVIALFVSAYLVYDRIFPKAPTVEVPDKNLIISMTWVLPDGTITESEYDAAFLPRFDFLARLEHAIPTRIMSANDVPDASEYYTISYVCEDKTYTYYMYETNGTIYAEIPYVGVYKI